MGQITDWLADDTPDTPADEPRGPITDWLREDLVRLQAAGRQDVDFERATRNLDMAARTGLPIEFIDRNLEKVEQAVSRRDFSPERFRRESPAFASWAAENPNHWAVVRDDWQALSGLEWSLKAFGAAYTEGWNSLYLNDLYAQLADAGKTPEDHEEIAKKIAELEEQIGGHQFGADGWWSEVVVETARQLPQFLGALKAGLKPGLAGAAAGAGAAVIAGQIGPQVLVPEEAITAPAAAAVGFNVGLATGAAEHSRRQITGAAYREFLSFRDAAGNPLDPRVARLAAETSGFAGALLEVGGLGLVLKNVPGAGAFTQRAATDAVKRAMRQPTFRRAISRFAGGVSESVGGEVVTEVSQEAVQILAGELAKEVSPGDFPNLTADQVTARLAEIAKITLQSSLVIGGAGPTVQLGIDAARARAARNQQNLFKALGESAQASKLRERLPAKFRELVDRVRKEGGIDAVRVDVDRFDEYFQSQNLDPEQVAAEITGSPDAYREAKATGADLVIPIDAYAEKVAATEHHNGLLQDLRMRPDDMTLREAETWAELGDKILDELANIEPEGEASGLSQPVYDDVVGQLLAAGYDRLAAEKQASLFASVFQTLGTRTGIDPFALYRRYALRISRPVPEVLQRMGDTDVDVDPMLDRLRSGDIPSEREAFGPSILEFLKSRGGLRPDPELDARDVGKGTVGLLRRDGLTLDGAAEEAMQAGYIQNYDWHELLEAIDRELAGEHVASPQHLNEEASELRSSLLSMQDYLESIGVDLDNMDNAQVKARILEPETFDQRAFHGSPHRFDRFSVTQIGTGEGAMAFGWGLYFSEARGTAEQYASALQIVSINELALGSIPIYRRGEPVNYSPASSSDEDTAKAILQEQMLIQEHFIKRAFEEHGEEGVANIMRQIVGDLAEQYEGEHEPYHRYFSGLAARMDEGIIKPRMDMRQERYVYEVEVPDSAVEKMLDWDAPIAAQTEIQDRITEAVSLAEDAVEYWRERLHDDLDTNGPFGYTPDRLDRLIDEVVSFGEYGPEFGSRAYDELREAAPNLAQEFIDVVERQGTGGLDPEADTGASVYQLLVSKFGSEQAASQKLLEVGIPGIKYLDALSRDEGTGTRNLVVFDDSLVTITAVNDQPVEMGAREFFQEPAQADLFDAPELSPKEQREEAEANYRILVRQEEVGKLNVGIDTVKSFEDAAHVLAPFRRHAQETILAIVTDKDDRIVNVIRHTKGTVDAASAYPVYLVGAILTTPGAANVWFGHNHPSGKSIESEADRRITGVLYDILKDTEVKVRGHVVVAAGGKMAAMDPDGEPAMRGRPIRPAPRRKTVSVTERVMRGRRPTGETINHAEQMARAFRDAGGQEGVLLLRRDHVPLGFVKLSEEEMSKLRVGGGLSRLVKAIAYTNAAAMAIYTKEARPKKVGGNMAAFANAMQVSLLDYMAGPDYLRIDVPFPAGRTFFQSELGLKSGLLEAARNLKQAKGTGEQMLAMLKKSPGVKAEEVEWVGVEEYLRAREGTVTKDELVAFIEANGVQVEEVMLAGDELIQGPMPDFDWSQGEILNEEDPFTATYHVEAEGFSFTVHEDTDAGNVAVQVDETGEWLEMPAPINNQNLGHAEDAITRYLEEKLFPLPEGAAGPAKYEQYTLPGGENYREVLLRVPEGTAPGFVSHAFDETNILAWLRLNDRTGPNGERILFVEEIQSDWHQQGRKKGYAKKSSSYEVEEVRHPQSGRVYYRLIVDGDYKQTFGTREAADTTGRAWMEGLLFGGVPDAPFKGNAWAELAIKRVLRMAAEGGYDMIAWTTGAQQVDRYDLSRVVARINFTKVTKDTWEVSATAHDGDALFDEYGVTAERIEELFGKEIAEKIVKGQGKPHDYGDGKRWRILEPEDMEVGGEGMKSFYDRTLPNLAKKIARKLDKSASVGSIELEETGSAQHALTITDDMREGAMAGQTLFQPKRGSITFRDQQATIKLFQAADLSTVLHEGGHLFLEVLGDLAESAGAPEQIVADYASILKWFGVENRQAITREHHEQFARGFEAYLREGKAPSAELQSAFATFRAWLVNIYRKITQLGVELNDEVRSVFDRMLATDDAIAAAQERQNYIELFSDPDEAGLSPEQYAVYRRQVEQARVEAEESLTAKLLSIETRETRKWWKREREKMREAVADEVHRMRVYRALAFLQRAQNPDGSPSTFEPVKLDRDQLRRRYGKDFIKRLPRPYVYAVQGGVDVDTVAGLFGYSSGDAMIQEMVNARPMRDLIEAETDARMREKFPDPMTDGSLANEALKAVHNHKRAELLAAELRTLRRLARRDRPVVRAALQAQRRQEREALAAARGIVPDADSVQVIRAAAERIIARKRVRDVHPHTYRAAEAKAARRAFEAAARKDYERAYQEKRKQILNHELYRQAERARAEAERTREYLTKFSRKAVRQRLGKAGEGLLEQIDAVIERVDLRRLSRPRADRERARQELLRMIEEGEIIASPEVVSSLKGPTGENWIDLSVEQLRGIRDIVKQLETRARQLSVMVIQGEKMEIASIAGQIADAVVASNTQAIPGIGQETRTEMLRRSSRQARDVWLRPAAIARILDGKDFGPITRYFIAMMRQAYVEKLIPMERKARDDMTELYRRFYSKEELGRFNQRRRYDALDADLSKSDILTIALNWGTESNREAMLAGRRLDGMPAYTKAGILTVLQENLDQRDWEFVQAVWDYLDSYWPQLRETEQRRRGIAPKKVPASAFTITTSDGQTATLRGGYFPLRYDPRHGTRTKAHEIEDYYKKIGNGVHVSATTRARATYERVGSGGQVVKLGLGNIDRHLHEIVRDIAIGDEVNFIRRVMEHETFKNAMKKTGNDEARQVLALWLQDAAVGELPAQGFIDHAAGYVRSGFTKAKLGWNALTTLLQFTGVVQSWAVLGSEAMAQGLGRYGRHPMQAHRHIMSSSAFMKARYEGNTWNKDIADTQAHLGALFGGGLPTRAAVATRAIASTFFWPIAKVQMMVDEVTWLAAYWKGVEKEGLEDNDAVRFADAQVENAQTSGIFSDRSAIERGTLGTRTRQAQFVRLWTTLISYMLAKGNIAYEKGRAFAKRPTLKGAVLFATDVVMLFTLEALFSAALYGRLPDGEDEDEPWFPWLARETLLSAISGVPFLREAPAAKFDSGNTPVGALSKDLFDLYVQASQGEVDRTLMKELNNVGGTLFHYPSSQTNRLIETFWRDVEGEDVEVYEFLTGERDRNQ